MSSLPPNNDEKRIEPPPFGSEPLIDLFLLLDAELQEAIIGLTEALLSKK